MATQRTTVRIEEGLAARLRRAHYLTKRSQNDIITDALDHWLANPRRPGCRLAGGMTTIQADAISRVAEQAAP